MAILSLLPESFRNLAPERVELHPRVNLIVGPNGQGKTNLLEALALVSGRPSFRTADLSAIPRDGTRRALVTVSVQKTPGGPKDTLGVVLDGRAREQYRNGKRISRLEASRVLPAVFLASPDLARLSGPPAERRRALDRVAFALEPAHGSHLARYERARTAKTRLLAYRGSDDEELSAFEGAMAEEGGAIAAARRRALAALTVALDENARRLRSPFAPLELVLESDLPAEGSADELGAALAAVMRKRRAEERRAGRCLAGPHRDDLALVHAGGDVAARASSGESRTLLLAWTLAELSLVGSVSEIPPFLAFDDFDSEWDPDVLAAFAAALPESGQVFLTSARPEAVLPLRLPRGAVLAMRGGGARRAASERERPPLGAMVIA